MFEVLWQAAQQSVYTPVGGKVRYRQRIQRQTFDKWQPRNTHSLLKQHIRHYVYETQTQNIFISITTDITSFAKKKKNGEYAVASPASGHVGTCPLAFEKFFFAIRWNKFSGLVWYYAKLLFVQPYSLWNDTIIGYNGACAKVNVVFTARHYA